MDTQTLLTRLWDYGWLGHDRVSLPVAPDDHTLIGKYVASPAFHTSFLPGGNDDTGIHGPFVAEQIMASDYVPLPESDLENYLDGVVFATDPAEDVAARASILPHLRHAFAGRRRCFVLNWTEEDIERRHGWGFVLLLFREFLFIGDERGGVDRFVIGYD